MPTPATPPHKPPLARRLKRRLLSGLGRHASVRRVGRWVQWALMPARIRWNDWKDARGPAPADGYPLPPTRLRQRVGGTVDAGTYLVVGARCADGVLAVLDVAGLAPPPGADVLDFGCGNGRVLRSLLVKRPGWSYTGIDIDPESIAWSRSAFPAARFEVNGPLPPTDLPDASFDLIVAISVFTHLDEEFQNAWLVELHRLLRPGGVLVASVEGAYTVGNLPASDRAELERNGFLYLVRRTGRVKTDGLPDFYQSARHTRAYVERTWTRELELVAYRERAINMSQDAVVLRRPPQSRAAPLYAGASEAASTLRSVASHAERSRSIS